MTIYHFYRINDSINFWVGQNMRDGRWQFSNVDDPSSASCPGVFLDWQIDTSQPNGNTGGQSEQDCIVFEPVATHSFQDRACGTSYHVICKATGKYYDQVRKRS